MLSLLRLRFWLGGNGSLAGLTEFIEVEGAGVAFGVVDIGLPANDDLGAAGGEVFEVPCSQTPGRTLYSTGDPGRLFWAKELTESRAKQRARGSWMVKFGVLAGGGSTFLARETWA